LISHLADEFQSQGISAIRMPQTAQVRPVYVSARVGACVDTKHKHSTRLCPDRVHWVLRLSLGRPMSILFGHSSAANAFASLLRLRPAPDERPASPHPHSSVARNLRGSRGKMLCDSSPDPARTPPCSAATAGPGAPIVSGRARHGAFFAPKNAKD
jgi:hypothetical protein